MVSKRAKNVKFELSKQVIEVKFVSSLKMRLILVIQNVKITSC